MGTNDTPNKLTIVKRRKINCKTLVGTKFCLICFKVSC